MEVWLLLIDVDTKAVLWFGAEGCSGWLKLESKPNIDFLPQVSMAYGVIRIFSPAITGVTDFRPLLDYSLPGKASVDPTMSPLKASCGELGYFLAR